MKIRILLVYVCLIAGLAACNGTPTPALPSATPTLAPTPTLPDAGVQTTKVPDAESVVQAYFQAWDAEDYPSMYQLLTDVSRDAITELSFTTRYTNVVTVGALSDWTYQILGVLVSPTSAQANVHVTLNSILVGSIERDVAVNLALENGQWRIQWDDAIILPELKGGNTLEMEYRIPARANIYDRYGHALVAQSDAVAIGVNTSQMDFNNTNTILDAIWDATGIRPETLRTRLENYAQSGWYLPVTDIAAEDVTRGLENATNYGLTLMPFRSRYYFNSGIAPHVLGYVSAIQAEEATEYKRMGYRIDERVGRAGLENWGEQYLGGVRSGALYVKSPDGAIVTLLAGRDPLPAQSITTTLEKEFQLDVQRSISAGFRGAVVVLERDTGRVLGMASAPDFDPNLFEPQNYNSGYELISLYDPETLPLFNRATRGQYPLGSVFKIITMAAALDSGRYTPESEYNCTYFFEELDNVRLEDWTWSHFQEDGETQASGILSLPGALMRSCNPWFWHIGLDLFNQGLATAVSDMSLSFGLGQPTGIQLSEEVGKIPVPASQMDATNLAIGQGDMQVTPLQVARFIAALGNGGTLYQPSVIEQIDPDGAPTWAFTTTVQGQLPIRLEDLLTIQESMVSVVRDPRGTARHRFTGLNINVAGKTGTAQSGSGEPHAWFAGYTFEENPDRPDIAIVVIVENQGEGSDYAAPIFRRVVEYYFFGRASTIYPWEAQIGVLPTPTPIPSPTPLVTDTPQPEEGDQEDGDQEPEETPQP